MDISFAERALYPAELRFLKALKNQSTKAAGRKLRYYQFVLAGLSGAILAYLAASVPESIWTFLFGTAAVLAFGFIVFTPFEHYKLKRQHARLLQRLDTIIEQGTVKTCLVHALRIAVADEYEDEGVLYIIEVADKEILYLWDINYNLQNKLPCLAFEIYTEPFSTMLGRQVYPLSARITPVHIDKKSKWNHILKFGSPGHLSKEPGDFDAIVAAYNAACE